MKYYFIVLISYLFCTFVAAMEPSTEDSFSDQEDVSCVYPRIFVGPVITNSGVFIINNSEMNFYLKFVPKQLENPVAYVETEMARPNYQNKFPDIVITPCSMLDIKPFWTDKYNAVLFNKEYKFCQLIDDKPSANY
jgi:hypothetical protein